MFCLACSPRICGMFLHLLTCVCVCVCVLVCVCLCVCPPDRVCSGTGRRRPETEAGLQAGAGGGLHEYRELRTTFPRAHWEETRPRPKTEPCLSEDLPSYILIFIMLTSSSPLLLPPVFKTKTSSLADDPLFFHFLFFFMLSSLSQKKKAVRCFSFSSSALLHRLVDLSVVGDPPGPRSPRWGGGRGGPSTPPPAGWSSEGSGRGGVVGLGAGGGGWAALHAGHIGTLYF